MMRLKSTKLLFLILSVNLLVSVMFAPISIIATQESKEKDESLYTILDTQDEVIAHLTSLYSSYSSVSVTTQTVRSPLQTPNYRQMTYTLEYNRTHSGTDLSGTCTPIAIGIITEYMVRNNRITASSDVSSFTAIFDQVVNAAFNVGWDGSNTPMDMAKPIMDGNFANFQPTYVGDRSTLLLESKLNSAWEKGIPTLVQIPSHTVVGAGLMTATVTYQKKNIFGVEKQYTDEIQFVIISDGWETVEAGNSAAHSYLLFDDVSEIIVPEL